MTVHAAEGRPAPLDERQRAVIEESCFFEPYKHDLQELFQALERPWSDDPCDLIAYIRSGWIGEEHGNSTTKDQFTPEQIARAMPVLERMKLTGEVMPDDGADFAAVVELGATFPGGMRRHGVIHRAVTQHGVTTRAIYKIDGQRPREVRDRTNDEILSTTGPFPGHDVVAQNPWARRLVDTDAFGPGNKWGITESELGRIAAAKLWGGLTPYRVDLVLTDVTGRQDPHEGVPPLLPDTPGTTVPARLIKSRHYRTDGGQAIIAFNAAAVARENGGPARPTTRSSTTEWLQENGADIPQGAHILLVSSNPHTIRTACTFYEVLQQMDRGDIHVSVAGAAAIEGAPIQLFLGEVGRMIDNDVKRNYVPKMNQEIAKLDQRIAAQRKDLFAYALVSRGDSQFAPDGGFGMRSLISTEVAALKELEATRAALAAKVAAVVSPAKSAEAA